MIKRYNTDYTNISVAAALISKSAKRRRSVALSAVKAINSETGLGNKLVAIK